MNGRVCAVQKSCGGCPLLALDRDAELKAKVDMVSSKLAEAGIAVEVKMNTASGLAADESRLGYRNRLRMQVVDGRADFFNEIKRNGCPVLRPDLWASIQHLISVTAESPSLLGAALHLEVRVGDDGSPAVAVPFPIDPSLLSRRLGPRWLVADITTTTPPNLPYHLDGGVGVDVPITSFVQVNSDVNRQLVSAVLSVADQAGAESFVDLFCGSGNFSIPLAKRGLRGVSVDNKGQAIAELGRSEFSSTGRINCVEGDARQLLNQLAPADLVVADPPRAGLQYSYDELVGLVNQRLVLIGCKASSFASDVAAICAAGLVLESVSVFDMFPGTRHVESLAVFSR